MAHLDEDEQLRLAIAASREQARLETMSEEELIAEAIAQSKAEEAQNSRKRVQEERSQDARAAKNPRMTSDYSDADPSTPNAGSAPNAFDLMKQNAIFSKLGSRSAASVPAQRGDRAFVPVPTISNASFTSHQGRNIDKLDGSLDLVFWKGWLKEPTRSQLRNWMLKELSWHKVVYTRPNGITIRTPRFTTTFGKDDIAGNIDSSYSRPPKKIPSCLQALKEEVERMTNAHFNTLIVNFYQDGSDSISYHADDETFLGHNPNIASLTLGSSRDFYFRRKAPAGVDIQPSSNPSGTKGSAPAATRPTEKFLLEDGDLLLMRGRTQGEWEHTVPARRKHAGGRINITFRRVLNRKGTENFLRYNLGDGPPYRYRNGSMVELPSEPGI